MPKMNVVSDFVGARAAAHPALHDAITTAVSDAMAYAVANGAGPSTAFTFGHAYGVVVAAYEQRDRRILALPLIPRALASWQADRTIRDYWGDALYPVPA